MLQAYLRGIDLWKGDFGRRSILRKELLINALDGMERSADGFQRLMVTTGVMAGAGINPKQVKKVLTDFGAEQERLEMVRNIDIRGLYQHSRVATTEEMGKVYEALEKAGMIGETEEEDDPNTRNDDPDL
jgi:hypothetical protein